MRKKKDLFDDPKRLLTQGVVIVVGGFGIYYFGNKIIQDIRRNRTNKQAADTPSVQQATVLRNAMNPSGIAMLMNFDTTNVDAVMNTAKQITNFEEVIKSYNNLYNATLISDLQTELSASEYQSFLNIISSNANKSNPNSNTAYAKKNQLVIAKLPVTVRKSPDATYHGAFYESDKNNNIYWQAKAGDFIGYATSNQHYDEKNNVKFIQIAFLVKKEGLSAGLKQYAGRTYTAWVSSSSSYVNLYSTEKEALSQYPTLASILSYKKPLDYYQSNLKGLFKHAVVCTKKTFIYDENLNAFTQVEAKTILGEFMGKLQTKTKTYIKFRTIDQQERWVTEQDAQLIES